MTKVTNRADGVRGFNVGQGRAVALSPGESVEVDLTEAAHHTLAGMVRNGELVLDEPDDAAGTAAEKIAADADAMAKRQAEAAAAEKADAEQRANAAEAIAKAADIAAERADAELHAQRSGDQVARRGAPPTPIARGEPPPGRNPQAR